MGPKDLWNWFNERNRYIVTTTDFMLRDANHYYKYFNYNWPECDISHQGKLPSGSGSNPKGVPKGSEIVPEKFIFSFKDSSGLMYSAYTGSILTPDKFSQRKEAESWQYGFMYGQYKGKWQVQSLADIRSKNANISNNSATYKVSSGSDVLYISCISTVIGKLSNGHGLYGCEDITYEGTVNGQKVRDTLTIGHKNANETGAVRWDGSADKKLPYDEECPAPNCTNAEVWWDFAGTQKFDINIRYPDIPEAGIAIHAGFNSEGCIVLGTSGTQLLKYIKDILEPKRGKVYLTHTVVDSISANKY